MTDCYDEYRQRCVDDGICHLCEGEGCPRCRSNFIPDGKTIMEDLQIQACLAVGHANIDPAAIERGVDEIKRLRWQLDNIKVRAYELGQIELHDMAMGALST